MKAPPEFQGPRGRLAPPPDFAASQPIQILELPSEWNYHATVPLAPDHPLPKAVAWPAALLLSSLLIHAPL